MKTTLLSLLLFIGSLYPIHAQLCSDFTIELRTQGAVDSFSTNYPDCDSVKTLRIIGDKISNLLGLMQITHCNQLQILGTFNLASLHGLDNLVSASIIRIEGTEISDMEGLGKLETVEYSFSIKLNHNLRTLAGLDSFQSVFSFAIEGNSVLDNLDGMPALQNCTSLRIVDNFQLTRVNGFSNIIEMRELYIEDNYALTSIAGFEALEKIDFFLRIIHNAVLTDLNGFESLTTVGRNIQIIDNPALSNLTGLKSLETVSLDLEIRLNSSLQNLNGLNALKTVGENLWISENQSLRDVSALHSLDRVGNLLQIRDNPQLESLDGIDYITYMGNLEIYFNDALSECDVLSVCNHLASGGLAQIGSNSSGCHNRDEILQECLVDIDDPQIDLITISPNPTSSVLKIHGIDVQDAKISLFDQFGRKYFHTLNELGEIDLDWLAAGCYYLQIQSGSVQVMTKVIKISGE